MVSGKKQPANKRRGPIPKGEYAGKAKTINTRVTPALRGWLDKAAKQNGRSLSQEIENRLLQTFTDEEKLADQFGDYRTALILRLVASHLNGIRNPETPAVHWLDDPRAFAFGMDALFWTLDAIRPKEPPDAQNLERIRDFDRPEAAFHRALSAADLSRRAWRHIAATDRAFPPPHVRMTQEQRLAHIVKNKIPEIVERSKTDIFGAPPEPEQPVPAHEPPPPYTAEKIEEINKVRRENYYCIYCDDHYTKDHGSQCPKCRGLDLSGRKHGGDGRQLELLSRTELNGAKQQ
jgi:hypothetical protein